MFNTIRMNYFIHHIPTILVTKISGLPFITDRHALELLYLVHLHKRLNLEDPVTYNEKVQWLKLHDRNPLYTTLVDKYAVKEWVSNRIGQRYVVPTIGVWNSFDDIDFNALPNSFVLKCTHDSGGLVICRNKESFDVPKARRTIEKSLTSNYYLKGREWPYKDVVPRIIAEEYMRPENGGTDLEDYKFFCFAGEPKAMFVATNRFGVGETCFDFFDMEWNHLPIIHGHPNAQVVPSKPKQFDEMFGLAKALAEGIPQVRVDFYITDIGVKFGEMTFSHHSGFVKFEPEEWDEVFGQWIKLNNINYMR